MEMWLKLEFIFQKTSQDNFLLQLPLFSGQLDYILTIFVFFLVSLKYYVSALLAEFFVNWWCISLSISF